jgi:hypothetical protein
VRGAGGRPRVQRGPTEQEQNQRPAQCHKPSLQGESSEMKWINRRLLPWI